MCWKTVLYTSEVTARFYIFRSSSKSGTMELLFSLFPFLLLCIASALQDSSNVAFGKNYSMVLVGGGLDDNNKVIR